MSLFEVVSEIEDTEVIVVGSKIVTSSGCVRPTGMDGGKN